MNKQELIERIKRLDESYLKAEFVLKLIKQLDEPEKVKVPEFIEDWIFECQLLKDFSLCDALDSNTIHLYAKNSEFVKKWLKVKKNQEIFARA